MRKRVKFGDLQTDEKTEIAVIAVIFASCQRLIDETNEEFKRLLERKQEIDEKIKSAREMYSKLEKRMTERLGSEFEIEVDEHMPEKILKMMRSGQSEEIIG